MATSAVSRTRSATPSPHMANITKAILTATMPASAASRPCSMRCRGWCWCQASACSGWDAARRTRKSPPISRRLRLPPSPMPRRSAASSPCRSPIWSMSNTGAAWQGRIGEVDEAVLRESFELNFYGHQRVAQAAVRIMRAQGTGGCLLFNVSKQAVNPGPDFGPYGLPKAATLFLVRQYALDYGSEGIRANAVNADRVRSGLLTEEMIASRSSARGLSEEAYMRGNLLGREVAAEDVAQAFLAQALALKTTADVTTVDGGNIAAAMR